MRSSLRPFFGFYGGKWRDSPRLYPPPRHRTIVEPFAGSAGYSVRYADRSVVLCEIDPVLAGVWEYLIKVREREILSIPDLPPSGRLEDMDLIPEAAALVGLWLNRAVCAPRKRASSWARSGIRPGSFWGDRVRKTIASQLHAIRHWRIYNCSYEAAPVSGRASWFVDPPYQVNGKHYTFGSEQIDYSHLGQWCQGLNGQVIACEQAGASWLPFSPLAETKTTRPGRQSREVAWIRDRDPWAELEAMI